MSLQEIHVSSTSRFGMAVKWPCFKLNCSVHASNGLLFLHGQITVISYVKSYTTCSKKHCNDPKFSFGRDYWYPWFKDQYIFIGRKPGPKFRKIYWICQSVRQCKPLSLNWFGKQGLNSHVLDFMWKAVELVPLQH